MRLIFLLIVIFGISFGIYVFITYFTIHFKELKKINWLAFSVSAVFGILALSLLGLLIYTGTHAQDSWCKEVHVTNSYPPENLVTATDYFEKANYEYDQGKCKEAIDSYAEAIRKNPTYPRSYNNKAYTYMRMGEYDKALIELNRAIDLDPNYVNAIMNRGDVYNYHLNQKDNAVSDYEKIISLTGRTATSVCGHLAMVKYYDKNNFLTFFTVFTNTLKCRNGK